MKIYPLAIITFLLTFSLQSFAYNTIEQIIRAHYVKHPPIVINNDIEPVIDNGVAGAVRIIIEDGAYREPGELPQPVDLPSYYHCYGLLDSQDQDVRMKVVISFSTPAQPYREIDFYFDLKDLKSGCDAIATSTDGFYSLRIYGCPGDVKLRVPSSVIRSLLEGYYDSSDVELYIHTYIIKGVNRFKRIDDMATLP